MMDVDFVKAPVDQAVEALRSDADKRFASGQAGRRLEDIRPKTIEEGKPSV